MIDDFLFKFLWTGNNKLEMPTEVRDYVMCAYVYHCSPSVLAEQDEATVDMHWHIRNELRKVRSEIQERKHIDVDL